MSARAARLDTLLRVRRIEEETSRGRLAEATRTERGARTRLERAHEQYAAPTGFEGTGVVSLAAPAPVSVSAFLGARRQRDALAGAVRLADGAAREATRTGEVARAAWSETAMRLAALERLDARAAEADRLDRLAADQRTAEESGASSSQTATTKRRRNP
jgi:flagellar biosynthesis chaperone FliJ